MEYSISLKWGGIHGDISVKRDSGELLYLLKGSNRWYRQFAVLDAEGEEAFRVLIVPRLLGRGYLIQSQGRTVGKAGTNWSWSQGYVEVADLPAVRCRYGWGMKSTLTLKTEARAVGSAALQRGFGIQWTLRLDDPVLDDPRFHVGCALLLWDYSSRG